MNNLLFNTTYTLRFAPFTATGPPPSDKPEPHDGEFVTAPAKGQPISLTSNPALEPPMWKVIERQDHGPEALAIVNAPRFPPPDTAEELGFSNNNIAPGTPVTLSGPTYYVLKPTPHTAPDGPLHVTIRPAGDSDQYCVAPAGDGTLQIISYDPGAETKPGWLITPSGAVI